MFGIFLFCAVKMTGSRLLLLVRWLGWTNHARTKGKYHKFPSEILGFGSARWLQQYWYGFTLSLLALWHGYLDLDQAFSNKKALIKQECPLSGVHKEFCGAFPPLEVQNINKTSSFECVFFSKHTAARVSGLPWLEASSYLRKSKWNVMCQFLGQDLTLEAQEVCAVVAILRLE